MTTTTYLGSGDASIMVSAQRIADEANMGLRTVERALTALTQSGWLVTVRSADKRRTRAAAMGPFKPTTSQARHHHRRYTARRPWR